MRETTNKERRDYLRWRLVRLKKEFRKGEANRKKG